jgi:hypothetical protein
MRWVILNRQLRRVQEFQQNGTLLNGLQLWMASLLAKTGGI